jgi:ABC-type nickel/cobalt efflux system permease component RcnA
MSAFGWAWSLYLIIFISFGLFGLYIWITEKKSNSLELLSTAVVLFLGAYLISVYVGKQIVPNVPYFILGSSAILMTILCWWFCSESKEMFLSEFADEEVDESERSNDSSSDEEIVDVGAKAQRYELISAEDGEILLDRYHKPVNPEEFGRAIGTLFSNRGSAAEVLDALNTMENANEDGGGEDDDSANIFSLSIMFLVYAPAAYVAYRLFMLEISSYGWI